MRVCAKAGAAGLSIYPSLGVQSLFDLSVQDGRRDPPPEAKQCLGYQHHDQELPRLGANTGPGDVSIEEVLQFVNAYEPCQASAASRSELLRAMMTITVFEISWPAMGSKPAKKVTATSVVAMGGGRPPRGRMPSKNTARPVLYMGRICFHNPR